MRPVVAVLAVIAGGLMIGIGLIWATQLFDDPLSF